MTDERPEWTPSKEQLAANLRHLRLLLDRRTPSFDGVSELLQAANLLCPATTRMDSIREVVKLAIDHPHAETWVKTAPLLYGLTDKSKGKPIKERRQLAFKASNEKSQHTWRTARETEMSRDLAAALIELVAQSQQTVPDTSDTTFPGRTIVSRPLDNSELAAAKPLSHVLSTEIRELCTNGFEKAHELALVSMLNKLAETVIQDTGSVMDKTNLLLNWAIEEAESDKERRLGIVELFGVGRVRGRTLKRRRDRAAPHLGYERSGELPVHGVEPPIFLAIRDKLLPLAVRAGLLVTNSRALDSRRS